MSRVASAIALLALLTGCGKPGDLEPAAGTSLPPAPYGASEPRTADELLELPPLAAPERSVELRRESEEREDDPFDLPPEG